MRLVYFKLKFFHPLSYLNVLYFVGLKKANVVDNFDDQSSR